MLRSVSLFGANGDVIGQPPTTFTYRYNVTATTPLDTQPRSVSFPSTAAPALEWVSALPDDFLVRTLQTVVDFNGDGRQDLVRVTEDPTRCSECVKWIVHVGLGEGGFSEEGTVWPGGPNTPILAARPFDGSHYQGLLDMDGDGLTDIFIANYFYRNTGRGFVRHPVTMPAGGYPDYFTRQYKKIDFDPTTPENSRTLQTFVDIDGDGCPDRLYVASAYTWWFNRSLLCSTPSVYRFEEPRRVFWPTNVDGTVSRPLTPMLVFQDTAGVTASSQPGFGGLSATQARSFTKADLIDLNGDGLIDAYHNYATYNSQGTTVWQTRVYMGVGGGFVNETHTYYASDIAAILGAENQLEFQEAGTGTMGDLVSTVRVQLQAMLDMNGDGRRDLVRVVAGRVQVHLNTGHGFNRSATDYGRGDFLQISSAFPHTGLTFTHWRLFDADGSASIDWVSADAIIAGYGKTEPDLLHSIQNGRGTVAEVTFENIVGQQGLHFPVPVVVAVTTNVDADVWYATDYTYRTGFFDRSRRRFVGFGDVLVRRRDNLGTPERFERRIFATGDYRRNSGGAIQDLHLGQWIFDDPTLTGLQLAFFAGPSADDIHKEIWTPWWPAWTVIGGTGGPAGTPQLLLNREYDLSADGANRVREISYRYDAHSNVSLIADHGEVVERIGAAWPVDDGDELYTFFEVRHQCAQSHPESSKPRCAMRIHDWSRLRGTDT